MTRAEKIELLQHIAAGLASTDELEPPAKYSVLCFDGPGPEIYVCNKSGQPHDAAPMTLAQFNQWQQSIQEANSRRRSPHAILQLTITQAGDNRKLYHCKGQPNCLSGCGCRQKDPEIGG